MWVPAYTYLLLLMTIPVSAVLFTQMSPSRAALAIMIGGTMFLPEIAAFDPPFFPPMDKHSLVMVCAFAGLLLRDRARIRAARPMRGIDLWICLLLATTAGTVMTNPDTLTDGGGIHWNGIDHFDIVVRPGLRPYDIISLCTGLLLRVWLPFFLGRALVRDRDDLHLFIRTMAFAGLVYVPLMLIEVVLSPQLHRWVYGYHSAFFGHSMRGSGFKPMVFLRGGLAVAMFQYAGLACAAACVRAKLKLFYGIPAGAAVAAIVVSLLLSRNVGVLVYIAATLPVMLALGPAMHMRLALVLTLIASSFPYTRANDTFPVERVLNLAKSVSFERYLSLKFRFDNEDNLLERALERPVWGWGSFGRNRIFDERTGRDMSVTDGEWVTMIGSHGSVGTVAWAAVLILPILRTWRAIKRIANKREKAVVGVLGLAMAVHVIDLLPNSAFTGLIYVLAGVTVGAVEVCTAPAPSEPPRHPDPRVRPPTARALPPRRG